MTSSLIEYDREIELLLSANLINSFMATYLNGLLKSGLDEGLWQEAIDDAKTASEMGVDSEQDFLTFFYIDHFVEDLTKEIFGVKLDESEEEELKKFMFGMKGEVDYNDLLSFRTSILKWLESKNKPSKKASKAPKYVKVSVHDGDKQLQHHYLNADKWDLPAGRIEENEEPAEAAARELLERTGYKVNASDLHYIGIEDEFFTFSIPLNKASETDKPQTEIRWCKAFKKAHPNIGKAYWSQDRYDLNKWQVLAVKIYKSIKAGFSKEFALKDAAAGLDNKERYDFMAWFNNYTSQSIDKYDVNNQIKKKNRELAMKRASLSKLGIYGDDQYYYVPTYRAPVDLKEEEVFKPSKREQDAQDFESVRKKMIGRVFSIDRLIEKYKNVLSEEQISAIEGTLNELKSKIRKLKMASTVRDSIIKTARILRNYDFESGASFLLAIAADTDVAPMEEEAIDVGQAKLQQEGLRKIIEDLYWISHTVKNRGLVRDLAKIDMQLNEMNMSSFFPELMEAQARLIEAFGYVGNKLDDIMPKLQGGLIVGELGKAVEKKEKPQPLAEEVKDMAKGLRPSKAPVTETPEVEPEDLKVEVPLATR